MPEHDIEITLPSKPLVNAGTSVVIKSDGRKLGQMHLSRGSLDWKSRGRKTAKSISWERVAELFNNEETDVASPRRVPWDQVKPLSKRKYRRGVFANLMVRLEYYDHAAMIDEYEGVDRWLAWMELSYNDGAPAAVIAISQLWAVNTFRAGPLPTDLIHTSAEGEIIVAAAMSESEEKLIAAGMGLSNGFFLVAEAVAVDPFWRGGQLGPALLWWAARSLVVEAIFLRPAASHTTINNKGVTILDPKPGFSTDADHRRVRSVWKRAGFRALRDGIWWANPDFEKGYPVDVAKVFNKANVVAYSPAARSWYRRRRTRIERENATA